MPTPDGRPSLFETNPMLRKAARGEGNVNRERNVGRPVAPAFRSGGAPNGASNHGVPLRHQVAQDKMRRSVDESEARAKNASEFAPRISKVGGVAPAFRSGGPIGEHIPSAKDQMQHAHGSTSPIAATAAAADRSKMGHPKPSQTTQAGPRGGTFYLSPSGNKVYKR